MERWATFDCYGTLIDWNGGIRGQLARLWGEERAEELLHRYHEVEPEVEADTPGMAYRDVMATVLARLGDVPAGEEDALGASLPGWRPFSEVPAALQEARDRGWRLAILTNSDRDLIEASKALLGVPFDETIVASEIGSYKPATRHWQEFFARTSAPREGHVHVAASHFHDVVPARNLGLRTVWINRLDEHLAPAPDVERRDLAGLADVLDAVLALMRAHDTAAWGDSDWTRDDLAEYWDEIDLERDARVVELDERLVGYADFESRGSGRLIADGYVDPATRGRGVGTALAGAVEERANNELEGTSGRAYLQYSALRAEAGSVDFFRRRGYDDVRHQYRMVVELDGPPDDSPPEGVELRPYRPGEEGAIHAAVEEAWSVGGWLHEPRPYEEWARTTFERPGHDPSLYFVAEAGGELAGVALCDLKRNGDWGWVDRLGVRPAWRRRGIGEALLRHSFAELFRRGERTVALQVDAESPTGATRLYERAGMRVLYEVVVWEKELRAA